MLPATKLPVIDLSISGRRRALSAPVPEDPPAGIDDTGLPDHDSFAARGTIVGMNCLISALVSVVLKRELIEAAITMHCKPQLNAILDEIRDKGHRLFLNGVDLSGLDLSGLNFSGCLAQSTSFAGARLERCNLSNADLTDADLNNATALGTTFAGATFNTTIVSGMSIDDRALLRIVRVNTVPYDSQHYVSYWCLTGTGPTTRQPMKPMVIQDATMSKTDRCSCIIL